MQINRKCGRACVNYHLSALNLVGGGKLVFVIRISVQFTSLCQRIARCLPQARCLCSENVAIGLKTSIEAY